MKMGDLINLISIVTVLAISAINHGSQQTEIDLLNDKVWHLEAIIELERFENEQENNG